MQIRTYANIKRAHSLHENNLLRGESSVKLHRIKSKELVSNIIEQILLQKIYSKTKLFFHFFLCNGCRILVVFLDFLIQQIA